MNNAEYEIDLMDLLYRVLKRWRSILICALIAALGAGLFQFAQGMRVYNDPERLAAAEGEYTEALSEYEADKEELATEVERLRKKLESQKEYNGRSILMRIDPENEWVGAFVIYIKPQYSNDPNLAYQNIDLTNRLLIAYSGYLRSGEFYNDLLRRTDMTDEARFLSELFSVEMDVGASTVTVTCVGREEDEVRELLALTKTCLAEKSVSFPTTVGQHSYEILTDSVFATSDSELDITQNTNYSRPTSYVSQLTKAETELTKLERSRPPKVEYGPAYTAKRSIKYGLFGGVAGIVVMAVLYVIVYALNGKVKTNSDWNALGLQVLCQIKAEKWKRPLWKVDYWLDRVFGRTANAFDLDTACKLAANNLTGVLKERGVTGVAVVSDLKDTTASAIVAKLGQAETGSRFVYAGNILTDPEAVKKLDTSEVFLLGQQNGTRMEDVQKMKVLLDAWGKTALGVIALD